MYVYVNVNVNVNVYVYVYVHMHVYAYVYACMHACMHVCARCMYVCTYVRAYVRMYVCMYACMCIAMDSEVIKRAQSQGVDVRGDIDLFVAEATVPVIGITGSNGKSTVTTYVGQLLTSCGLKVAVGGNIGVPALDLLDCDPMA